MEYRWIRGFREGSRKLLYIPSQKLLYIFKTKRRGRAIYICYQSILSASKKQNQKKNEDHTSCTSRVRLLPDGTCEKMNMNHTCHQNHEKIVRDMEKTNNMKRKCQTLKKDYPEVAHKISTRNIFQREMVEYVFFCFHSVKSSYLPTSVGIWFFVRLYVNSTKKRKLYEQLTKFFKLCMYFISLI